MNKKLFKYIICGVLMAALITVTVIACRPDKGKVADTVATTAVTVTESTEEPVTVEAPPEVIISFEIKDDAGNVLTMVPIYNADAVTIIAGYVQSAKDKSGNALTAENFAPIGQIVGITAQDGKLVPDTGADGGLLMMEAYSDDAGNIIAFRDVKDLNQNNNKDEFLKLNLVTDANGIVRYMTEYTVVTVDAKKDGTATVTLNGEKKKATVVDAKNKTVADKIESDKKKNEEQAAKPKPENDKTPAPTPQQETPEKPEEPSPQPETPEEPAAAIVLLANRTAKSDADGVAIATGSVTITKPGDYEITSETDVWHGQIIVKLSNTEKAEIAFRNVNIQNDTTNIIRIIDSSIDEDRSFLEAESGLDEYADDYVETLSEYDMAPNVQLSFPEGTSSSFYTTANSHTGVLYNESKLTIKGHGTAEFGSVRNPNNCICSSKSIKIRNLNLKLTTPQNENTSVLDKATGSAKGIFSYSRVIVESGTLNIKTNGDGIRCQKLEIQDGSINVASSACDGVDADDLIMINGGSVKVTALQKSSFKVRRINNTEKGYIKGRVRAEKGDTFAINAGTVVAESKKVSTVQPDSAQASLSCRIVKPSAGTTAALTEIKTPAIISISGVKSSGNKCTKFLYSSSSVKSGTLYAASAGNHATTMTAADWNGPVGTIRVVSDQAVR